MGKAKDKNFLVALFKEEYDREILLRERWYRIPVESKRVPRIIKSGEIEYIAFYHNRQFKKEPAMVKYYGKVKNISIQKRKYLFPELENDPKQDDEYYKIEIEEVKELEEPIISKRPRRILFISTTYERFVTAEEINHLFYESTLEERMYSWMREAKMEVERQLQVKFGLSKYRLDFAIFCRDRNIDIECDGDFYHTTPKSVASDNQRDNKLASNGWSVLRYNENDIKCRLDEVQYEIRDTINSCGGIAEPAKSYDPDYFEGFYGKYDIY